MCAEVICNLKVSKKVRDYLTPSVGSSHSQHSSVVSLSSSIVVDWPLHYICRSDFFSTPPWNFSDATCVISPSPRMDAPVSTECVTYITCANVSTCRQKVDRATERGVLSMQAIAPSLDARLAATVYLLQMSRHISAIAWVASDAARGF